MPGRGEAVHFREMTVALDGSDNSARALGPALMVADRLQVSVRVVSFQPEAVDCDEIAEVIDRQVLRAGGPAHSVEILTLTSSVAEQIKALVDSSPGMLLAMSTRGRGNTAAFLGSVANETVARTGTPVLLIGPGCDRSSFDHQGPLVIAADDERRETRAVLDLATCLLTSVETEARIISVLDPRVVGALDRAAVEATGGEVPQETGMVHALARGLREATGRPVDYQVLHAKHVGPAIAAYALEEGALMIMMATRARRGIRRLALGSVTAEVVARSRCPVLTVAPPEQD